MLKVNRRPATILAAILAVVIAAALIACTGNREGDAATPTTGAAVSQTKTKNQPAASSRPPLSTLRRHHPTHRQRPRLRTRNWLPLHRTPPRSAQTVTAASQGSSQAGIWVSGIGTKEVEADVAVISLGVESREKTVAAARGAAAEAMTGVLDALSTLGVDDDDVVTTSLNIYPIQVWIEVRDDDGSHNEPRITGYTVNNQVRVTVRDIEMADEVIDKAAEVGGDLIRINNISFTVGDPAAHADEIRRRAVEDAKAKAELYAEAFGVELGPVVFVQESSGGVPVEQGPVRLEMAMARASDASTPIESGDINLSITIQAGFSILPSSGDDEK